MRRHPLTFITVLILSLILTRFIGEKILDSSRLRINPKLKERIVESLTTSRSQPTATKSPVTKESFAQCLASKNFTMYGTPECPSCKLQKSYFGDSFRLVPYVDCNAQRELCQNKGINAYPTWEDKNNKKYKGAIPLQTLARLAGCESPI